MTDLLTETAERTQPWPRRRGRTGLMGLRLAAGNVIGWISFMTVVRSEGRVPFWIVPFAFGVGAVWASGALEVRMTSRLGYATTTALGIVGSMFGLIGTQAMTGHESVAEMLPDIATSLVIVHAVTSAVGLSPLAAEHGAAAWRAGVAGFAAGAALEAFLVAMTLGRSLPYLWGIMTIQGGLPMWLPSICGGLAIAWTVGGIPDGAALSKRETVLPSEPSDTPASDNFVVNYFMLIGLIVGGALIATRFPGLAPKRAVVVMCGGLFLWAVFGQPRWVWTTVRNAGWFKSIRSDDTLRLVLFALAVFFIGLALLAPGSALFR